MQISRPVGAAEARANWEYVDKHQSLAKRGMGACLDRIRLQPVVEAKALARAAVQREQRGRQRAEQQAILARGVSDTHRRHAHRESDVLDVSTSRFEGPAFGVVARHRGGCSFLLAGHFTPEFLHRLGVHAQRRADVHIGLVHL